jgi:adenylosuccinate synthase
VLDTFPTIRVAVAYVTPDGEKLTSFPADLNLVSGSSQRLCSAV